MITTVTLIVLFILIVLNWTHTKGLIDSLSGDDALLNGKIDTLNNMDVSRGRMIQSLQKELESIRGELSSLRANPSNQGNVLDSKITSIELSIQNLYADLDRTIGTIDQVQEKIAEINVTLENIVNRLNNE